MVDPQPSFEAIFDDQELNDGPIAAQASGAAIDELFSELPAGQASAQVDHGDYPPRFEGDTSQLPPEVSWTLQHLVAAPHFSEAKSKKLWPVLLQHEDLLRSRLSELGLALEINLEHNFAFTRQIDDPSPHSRNLLRAQKLSLAASALLLYLYNQYLISPDAAVVERDDMMQHMLGYMPADSTDAAGFHVRIDAAIRQLNQASIIKQIPETTRYLIYGVITSILTADRVEALTARFRALATRTNPDASNPSRANQADTTETDTEEDNCEDEDE